MKNGGKPFFREPSRKASELRSAGESRRESRRCRTTGESAQPPHDDDEHHTCGANVIKPSASEKARACFKKIRPEHTHPTKQNMGGQLAGRDSGRSRRRTGVRRRDWCGRHPQSLLKRYEGGVRTPYPGSVRWVSNPGHPLRGRRNGVSPLFRAAFWVQGACFATPCPFLFPAYSARCARRGRTPYGLSGKGKGSAPAPIAASGHRAPRCESPLLVSRRKSCPGKTATKT